MEDIANRVPVNKNAAVVVSRGNNERVYSKWHVQGDSPTFLPLRDIPKYQELNQTFENLTGIRFGRLTVVGMSANYNARWSCRCDCGWYVLRRRKAIKNPENTQDRCAQCRNIAHLKRSHEQRVTGRDVDIRKF